MLDMSSIKKRWTAEVFIVLLFSVILAFCFAQETKGQILDLLPVSLLSLCFSIPALYIAKRLNLRAEGALRFKDTASVYVGFLLVFFFVNLHLLSFINSALDTSSPRNMDTTLGEGFLRNDNNGIWCFRAKASNGESTIDGDAFCTDKFPNFKEGDKVLLRVKAGLLGFEWYDSIAKAE